MGKIAEAVIKDIGGVRVRHVFEGDEKDMSYLKDGGALPVKKFGPNEMAQWQSNLEVIARSAFEPEETNCPYCGNHKDTFITRRGETWCRGCGYKEV